MIFFAQPETAAESGLRIFGAAIAVAGAVELYGLYGMSNPTHWLANLQISIGDGSFRTLSMAGAISFFVGAALYLRKGIFMILGVTVISLMTMGYGKYYSIGNAGSVSSYVSAPGINKATPQTEPTDGFIDTGVSLTPKQKKWCSEDDDGDGVANWDSSRLARKNCATYTVHTESR
ncbi:hypothetical protein VSS37_17735 [Candidatus Thiothrix sp. Deng01]|uniref:DoxX family protein n=1 Tax=Candidatus Thiothrix phosphatis TaxID=3112415 RepID=A0ABU6D176_9GAMM|nr:hypothetical protein [Candidatus Thiothrix sp. Deng01]MEB4592825.1 hypothetical protein [Candidatus Thiothrix sp. Deng01]